MNSYVLLAGTHGDESGETYEPGDVVESDRDLVAAFGDEKFATKEDFEKAMANSDIDEDL